MFWGNKILEQSRERFAQKIKEGKPILIRDEKTASGRVHVGSMRGVAIHGIVSEVLSEAGVANKFLYEINDFDPMDGLPVYLDKEKFLPYMGKPLCDVPSPDGKAKNYPEYFAEEFMGVITAAGFTPEFYRSSDVYKAGRYDECIRLALVHADKIRDIYKKVSGATKEDKWLPLNVVCEKCGKVGTTRASDFDGDTVAYSCGKYAEWAEGCGHNGRVSPFGGKAKLPWKVEWAAKFSVFDVDIEGGGKDHSTRGGAREVAEAISREVFKREPPINIPYEFFVVGGKKMSSSKGAGSSAKEVSDLLPPEVFRFLMTYKEPQKVIDFIPDGDTVPILYDTYDKFAEGFFAGTDDDFSTVFKFAQLPSLRASMEPRTYARFSSVAYLVQMPHLDMATEIEKLQGKPLTALDREELVRRGRYAKIWLDTYAPEDYKFEIQKVLPEGAKAFTEGQKDALRKVLEFVSANPSADGQQFHTALHEIKTASGITPKEFFGAIYESILGKGNGPKAGWFLSVLDKEFLKARLREASE